MTAFLTCSCCGAGFDASTDQAEPGEHDAGFGVCMGCGGNPKARKPRKRAGWAYCAFIDARIPVLREQLNETNRARFDGMSWEAQGRIIEKMIERGAMI